MFPGSQLVVCRSSARQLLSLTLVCRLILGRLVLESGRSLVSRNPSTLAPVTGMPVHVLWVLFSSLFSFWLHLLD